MTLSLCYWILMLVALIFGGTPLVREKNWGGAGMGLVVWLLFLIVGWAVFGQPIKG